MHFPVEKTVIYKYYADVKAGVIEPAQYASQFALSGQLHIKKDVSDPTLNNAYYVKLQDVKYGMHNGMSTHQPIEVVHELGEVAQQIQDPFLVVYDESGKVKTRHDESIARIEGRLCKRRLSLDRSANSVAGHQSGRDRERLVAKHQTKYCLDDAAGSVSRATGDPDQAASLRHV